MQASKQAGRQAIGMGRQNSNEEKNLLPRWALRDQGRAAASRPYGGSLVHESERTGDMLDGKRENTRSLRNTAQRGASRYIAKRKKQDATGISSYSTARADGTGPVLTAKPAG